MKLGTGYKQLEMERLPRDWQVKILSEVVKKDRPISYGIVQTGKPVNNGIKCVRVIDLIDGIIDDTNLITTSDEISNSYRRTILREGDLVIALRGKIGEVAVVGNDLAGSNLTRGVAVIACKETFSNQFIKYQLKSEQLRRTLENRLAGSALKELSLGVLRKVPIPVPPTKAEQAAIAGALSDADALISRLEHLIAKKRNIKQGAMQELLTGKKRLPGCSGEWEVKKLGEVCQLKNGYAFKSSTYDDKGEYLIITIANVQDGYMDIAECNMVAGIPNDLQTHQKLGIGDVLISMTGNVGRVCKVNTNSALLNQRVGKLVPMDIDSDYLLYLLGDRRFLTQMIISAQGGAQGNIGKNDILEYSTNIPKEKLEQAAIAKILSDMDAEIEQLEQKVAKYRMIKQGMMQELLTGKTRLI